MQQDQPNPTLKGRLLNLEVNINTSRYPPIHPETSQDHEASTRRQRNIHSPNPQRNRVRHRCDHSQRQDELHPRTAQLKTRTNRLQNVPLSVPSKKHIS